MADHVSFDANTCTSCGNCVEHCRVEAISLGNDGVPIFGDGSFPCFKCGHCEAFCPTGAARCDFPGELARSDDAAVPSSMQLKRYMQNRRTTRAYRDTPVDRSTIEEILDTVRYAPSGKNLQPLHWVILHDRKSVEKLASAVADWMRETAAKTPDHPFASMLSKYAEAHAHGRDMVTHGAPHVAVVTGSNASPWAETDGHIALTWFELAAQAYGLGTCWLGVVKFAADQSSSILDAIGIPEGYKFVYAMTFGYRVSDPVRIPKRNPAKATWR